MVSPRLRPLTPLWFEEVLRRARDQPLIGLCRHFFDDGPTDFGWECVQTFTNLAQLLASQNQFRELHIQIHASVSDSVIEHLVHRMQQPMPLLTAFSLDLRGNAELYMWNLATAGTPLTLLRGGSASFAAGIQPRKSLDKTRAVILWNPHIFLYHPITAHATNNDCLGTDISVAAAYSGISWSGPQRNCRRHIICTTAASINVRLKGDYKPIVTFLICLYPAELVLLSCEVSCCWSQPDPCTETFRRLLASKQFQVNKQVARKAVMCLREGYLCTEITTPQKHNFYVEFEVSPSLTRQDNLTYLGLYRVLFPIYSHLVIDGEEPIGYYYKLATMDDLLQQNNLILDFMRLFPQTEVAEFRYMPLTRALGLLNVDDTIFPSLAELSFSCTTEGLDTFEAIAKLLRTHINAGKPLRSLTFRIVKEDYQKSEAIWETQAWFIREEFRIEVKLVEDRHQWTNHGQSFLSAQRHFS